MKCRISKAHVMVYRAVEGAVRNTKDGHPNWPITRRMAESIAKRATGTLTAGWPDVLAARTVPSIANDPCYGGHWPPRRFTGRGSGSVAVQGRHSPLKKLHDRIGNWAGTARRQKDFMKVQVLIEVLREINKLEQSYGR